MEAKRMTLEYRPEGPPLAEQFWARIPDLSGRNTMNQGPPVTAAEARGLAEQAHDDAVEAYETPTDHELGLSILDTKEQIENMHLALRLLEADMQKRIVATGGTALPDDAIEMKLEPGRIVNTEPNHLVPLKEIFTTADLKAVFTDAHDEAIPEQVIPAYTEHVPEKWATLVKLKAMARKYGDAALAHVDRAGIRSDPHVVVTRKGS